MGNVRLYGSTSGYTELAPPAVAPDGVLSLPSGTGTLLTAEGGKILQVVRATDTTDRSTTSASFVDVTGMSVTITPTKATSSIMIVAAFRVISDTATNGIYSLTDSADTALSGAENAYIGDDTSSFRTLITLTGYVSPATTSAVTYKLRFRVESAGTIRVGNASLTGQMYAIEVSA